MTNLQYIRLPKIFIFMSELKKTAKMLLEYLTMKWDYLESKHKTATEIYYNISQKKLASELGISLRSVNSAISQLKKLGLVKVRPHSETDCTLDYIKTDITETEVFQTIDDSKKFLYEEKKTIKEEPSGASSGEKETDDIVDDDVITLMDCTEHKFSRKQLQKLISIIKEKDSTANPVEIITRVYCRMRSGGFKIKKWFSYLLKSVKSELEPKHNPVQNIVSTPNIVSAPTQSQPQPQSQQKNLNIATEEFEHQSRKVEYQKERESNKLQSINNDNIEHKTETQEVDEKLIRSIQLKIMQDYQKCVMTLADIRTLYKHIQNTLVVDGLLDNCDIFVYICRLCNRVITNINYKNIKINSMVAYMMSIVTNDKEIFKNQKVEKECKEKYADKPSYDLDRYINDLQKYY